MVVWDTYHIDADKRTLLLKYSHNFLIFNFTIFDKKNMIKKLLKEENSKRPSNIQIFDLQIYSYPPTPYILL